MTDSGQPPTIPDQVFISFSQIDEKIAQRIARDLRREKFPVWIAEDLVPGTEDWDKAIREAIANSFAVVLLASPDSRVSRFVKGELNVAQIRGCRILPVWVSGSDWADCVPLDLTTTQRIDLRGDRYAQGFEKLYSTLRQSFVQPPGPSRPQGGFDLPEGVAPVELVFGEKKLPGQVFAIELLTKPVLLRKRGETTFVTVNRSDVTLGLYKGEGRRSIVEQTFKESGSLKRAEELDKEIHRYLTTGGKSPLMVRQPNLRWASGGVVSIVEYRQREWIPFFFRDIPAYGWNISLGASEERTDDLNDPWSFIIREFLEESLVCRKDPHTLSIIKRPFIFDRLAIDKEIELATHLSERHESLRFERDLMQFTRADPLHVRLFPTRTALFIEDGVSRASERQDVLVVINIRELGIEVIKVLKYELQDDEYILDGELYEPAGPDRAELVRMPVALISLDYLLRAFPPDSDYTFFPKDPILPSVIGPEIPPEDIHIFDHDVIRRRDIAVGCKSSATAWQKECHKNATEWERESYTRWINEFGGNFLDLNGNPANSNASRLFTPTAAKVMAYLTANL